MNIIYEYKFLYLYNGNWLLSDGYYLGIKEAMHFIDGSNIEPIESTKRERT